MREALLNLLFGCRHRRITRPITPVRRANSASGATYVACLDCGQQFGYDPVRMRMAGPVAKESRTSSKETQFQTPNP
jgi:hypothetical protein